MNAIVYKKIDPVRIASIKAQITARSEILPLLEELRAACSTVIDGEAIVIFHGGAVKDGFLIEAAYPVTQPVETGRISTRTLEAASALSTLHHGPHQNLRETTQKIYEYLGQHAWTASQFRREIYRVLDESQPENNITEILVILHEWDRLLSEGSEKTLGAQASQKILQGIEAITPESSKEDYTTWIQGAIARLDTLTDSQQKKYQVVSHCAHVFPQERIDILREIYLQSEFDDILHEMYQDHFWYEKPVRRGNVIYMRKNPYDPEGYEMAATPAERRKAYCHCSFVHPYLDEIPSKLSQTFCYCGAGWYKRLWEGILGQPVKIEQVETLLRGNDQCTFTITLPLELEGECSPEPEKV